MLLFGSSSAGEGKEMKHEDDVQDGGKCEGRFPFDSAWPFVCKDEIGGREGRREGGRVHYSHPLHPTRINDSQDNVPE